METPPQTRTMFTWRVCLLIDCLVTGAAVLLVLFLVLCGSMPWPRVPLHSSLAGRAELAVDLNE
eukprot:scaffold845_cov364-Prasinococcus_capsulatus_cf.AAC.3